jgi:hypothetical protein
MRDLRPTYNRDSLCTMRRLHKGVDMLTGLLLSNVPFDCSEDVLKKWIEDHGYVVLSVRLIQDVVSRTSPSFAHVQLSSSTTLGEAERVLNGQILRGHHIRVRRLVPPQTITEGTVSARKRRPKTASA